MKILRKRVFLLIVLSILAYLYRNWFSKGVITAPDLGFYFPGRLNDFSWLPFAWSSVFGSGLGAPTFNIFYLDMYINFGIRLLVFTLGIPWSVVFRMLFFFPFLFVGGISSHLLVNATVKSSKFAGIGMLIYLSNTYILMIASGGQMGLVLAYAVAPCIFLGIFRRDKLLLTLASIFMVLFDLRFSYLIGASILMLVISTIPIKKWVEFIQFIIPPVMGVILFHSVWIIPSVIARSFSLPDGYNNPGWLTFLSWAELSKTLSLLHPNWPENIFGKTYFMRPEFVVLPILAFSVLAIGKIKSDYASRRLLFYVLLGLLGAFFAKGVNPPFGGLYEWMFSHVPYFDGFRDPTKFYLLIAISYAVLIPCALEALAEVIDTLIPKIKRGFSAGFIIVVFLGYWAYLLIPAFDGTVKGTLVNSTIPAEHYTLESALTAETDFSRVMAVPWRNNFVFQSENHPIVDARYVFETDDVDGIITKLSASDAEMKLLRLAVKHVVVPNDFHHEIFLSDRQYDPAIRKQVVSLLDTLPFLRKREGYGGLDVYDLVSSSSHVFRVNEKDEIESYLSSRVHPGKYVVQLTSEVRPQEIIFSERYNPHWVLWDGNEIIKSVKTADGLNSFKVYSDEKNLEILNDVQPLVDRSRYITIITIVILLLLIGIRIIRIVPGPYGVSLAVLVLILCVAGYVSAQRIYPKNQNRNPNIRWSNGWNTRINPIDGMVSHVSPYGGNEIRFRVLRGSAVRLGISGVYPDDGNAIEFYFDGIRVEPTTISHGAIRTYTLETSKPVTDVRLRTVCAGTPNCHITVHSVFVSRPGRIGSLSALQKTIAVLGDSISTMYGGQNYTYILADALGMQVSNASVVGSTLTNMNGYYPGIDRVKEDIVKLLPEIVIISLGTNDATKNVPIDVFTDQYNQILAYLRTNLPESYIYSAGMFRRRTEKDHGIVRYNQAIQEASVAHGAMYIDMYELLEQSDFLDGLHPTKKAQMKIAGLFETAIRKDGRQ